jgi:hypothetical protein
MVKSDSKLETPNPKLPLRTSQTNKPKKQPETFSPLPNQHIVKRNPDHHIDGEGDAQGHGEV